MTPSEAKRLRARVRELAKALRVCREACRANLVKFAFKDERALLTAFQTANAALARKRAR